MGLVLANVIGDQEELPNIRRRARHQGEEYLLRPWPTALTPRRQDKEPKICFYLGFSAKTGFCLWSPDPAHGNSFAHG